MITGIDKFRIIFGTTVYEPSGWCNLVPDIENLNFVRRSQKTSKENVRASWNYYNASAKVKHLTAEDIAFFRSISGQEVLLYPNIDVPGISYYCSVTKAEIKYENGKPWKPYVDLRFDGVYDVSILTTETAKSITLTAPVAGSYVHGGAVTITWTSANILATDLFKIDLYKAGVFDSAIVASTVNDGTYAWTVPADATIGNDYQIKIIDVNTGLIWDLSDANFSIDYDGFYLFDGSDDWIAGKSIGLSGNKYTIAFTLKHPTGTTFRGYPDYSTYFFWKGYLRVYDAGAATWRVTDGIWLTDIILPAGFFAADNLYHTYIFTVDKDNSVIAVYKDNVWVAGYSVAGDYLTQAGQNFNFGALTYWIPARYFINACEIKNIILVDNAITETERGYYEINNITAIDNKVLWYKCNDADAGTPWTDNAVDSSGNANHGTPTNITGATFFNQS